MHVRARVRYQTSQPQPNGLQATDEGLWVIDQRNGNMYRMRYEDGEILELVPTRAVHASGITMDDDGNLWVASTFSLELLKIDRRTGRVRRRLPTPGAKRSGAHGLEFIEGRLWVTVPPSATTYALDPASGRVLHSFPAPGSRPHGLAWDGETLWVAETNHQAIYRYDLREGRLLEKVTVEGPEIHGMTMHNGIIWYCDATTRSICTVDLREATHQAPPPDTGG
jgi:sugar lactone lactonase YvrE